ncbi:MAG: SGNH/GDSL hydrolase family protein [Pseudomonadota bacterium]
MSRRLHGLLANLSLLGGTLLVIALFAEFFFFRFIMVPDDVLPNVTANGVVRYAPNTVATFRHPDGSTSTARINQQGWNSTKAYYRASPPPGRVRIAVVGDSYVHGAFIDVEKGFPNLLEETLNARSVQAVEVLRFGMDGAPLSQYLHMMRREVLAYRPDVIVVPLIHNDFDESFRFLKTRYASAFLKMRREADGSVTEIAPAPFRPGLADALRQSAAFRFLYYETNLYLHLKSFVSRWFWGGDEVYEPEFISSAVDIRKLGSKDDLAFYTLHIMQEMKTLAEKNGVRLLFVMDGVREAVYAGSTANDYAVGKLNRIAHNTAANLELPFVDLQTAFATHYARHAKRFEFPFDWHWNELGNRIVADRIADALMQDPAFLTPRSARLATAGAPSRAGRDVSGDAGAHRGSFANPVN